MMMDTSDQGRFHELEPIGVIDIGSNSVRLVVYEGAVRAPFPIYNEKILCGLGRSMQADGSLEPASVERALAALDRFKAIVRTLRAKNVQAIATAAVRDAVDGADFIQRAQDVLGVEIQVLTGEREAQLAANGVKMGFVDPDGIGGDLGGGSLELINLEHGALGQAVTLPLGGLRLMTAADRRLGRAQAITDKQLETVTWLKQGRGRPFYAIGGTWRALAKLHMEETNAPLRLMHGYTVKRSEMIRFCTEVRQARGNGDIPGLTYVSRSRREALPYGALVLARLLERFKPREVVFSIYGIREGLLYSYLSKSEQDKDPLIAFLPGLCPAAFAIVAPRLGTVHVDGSAVRTRRRHGNRKRAPVAACGLHALRHRVARPGRPSWRTGAIRAGPRPVDRNESRRAFVHCTGGLLPSCRARRDPR